MYKRPQIGETDEDLLRLQEEFLKQKAENKFKLAATVVSAKPYQNEETRMEQDVAEQLSNTFEQIPENSNIGMIVEKNPTYIEPIAHTFSQKVGFPTARRRDLREKQTVPTTRGSIFLQQMKKKMKVDNTQNLEPVKPEEHLPVESFILTGVDKQDIHKENVNRLSAMTQDEIMEERDKLITTMDPAIISFLKSRRERAQRDAASAVNDIEKQKKAAENLKVDDIDTVSDVLTQPKAERWIHFDEMETAKLAWMKNLEVKEDTKKEGYEARFDFNGWLLKYEEQEITEKSRSLYHHGEEPNRPGYTLQELFQLARSNVIQQKVTALNSMANLARLDTYGVYDDVIDIPIEQMFFVIRFCLDDNTPFVLNAAVKALRSLFCYPIDEACTDRLLAFGFVVQPTLCSEEEDEEDDETINDQQLAETNLVKCLVRTGILTRIRYIINTVRPQLETILYVLEILIRLSRDSLRIATLVFKNENLIESVIKHFVPKVFKENTSNLNYAVPMMQAVKLCRILATRGKYFAEQLVKRYNIMDSIIIYLSNEHFSSNTSGVQLQMECLHLWTALILNGLTLDYFSEMTPILIQILHFHFNKTNLNTATYTMQAHFAAFMSLLNAASQQRFTLVLPYLDIISKVALQKWITQFNSLNNFTCEHLLVISSLLHFLANIIKYKACVDTSTIVERVKSMIVSHGFSVVTSNISVGSNIFCPHKPHIPTKNLVSMEGAIWNASEHVVPVLQANSCIPFLNNLSKFVEQSDDNQLKLQFLNHKNIQGYLSLVKSKQKYNLMSNWFTQVESELMMNILKISHAVHRSIDTSVYYVIAVKCLSIFNSRQKGDLAFLFKNVIFNKEYYPGDVLLKSLNITDENSFANECLLYLEHIYQTYIEVLGLQMSNSTSHENLSTDIKIGNVIPIDWIYSPIVVLYANSQKKDNKISEEKLVYIICNCLRWVFIYETYFSELSAMINPIDKFCRLACVFLVNDDLFLVPEVREVLSQDFQQFIKTDFASLDFGKSVHGLSNFQDFYTQLLEQYQGVSYSDVLFSNFILIPLEQKAPNKYRKLLWSEYAGVAQVCRITKQQLMYPIDVFLQPVETDSSLIICYGKYLRGRATPNDGVLKLICTHHLNSYMNNKQSQIK